MTEHESNRQLDTLNLSAKNVLFDRTSGKDINRPELQNLSRTLREEDILNGASLDMLTRKLEDLSDFLDH